MPDDLLDAEDKLLNEFDQYDDKEKIQFMLATIMLLLDEDQIKFLIRLLQERVQ